MVLLRSIRVFFWGGVESSFAYSYVFGAHKGTLTRSSWAVITNGPQKSEHKSSLLTVLPCCLLPSQEEISSQGSDFSTWKRLLFPGVTLSKDFKGLAISGRALFFWFHFSFFFFFFFSFPTLCTALLLWSEKQKQGKGNGNTWMNFRKESMKLMRR